MFVGAFPFFYQAVDAANVAEDHRYADPTNQTIGTNDQFAPTTDPAQLDLGPAGYWGWTHPANAAAGPSVGIPGLGQGTAATLGRKPSRLISSTIHAFTNESSLHCVDVFDEECDPLDLTNRSILFLMWDRHQNPTFSADATGTKTGFEVTIDALEQTTLDWEWVARDETSREVLAFGRFKGKALPDSNP